MLIGYSDLILLGEPPNQNIQLLADKYQAEMVELMMDGVCWWEDPSFWKDSLAKQLQETGIKISLHPPTISMDLSCDSTELRLFGIREHHKAIQLAAQLKAEHVVIHPGFCCENPDCRTQALERSLDSLERLLKIAREAGVKLAVENIGSRQYGDYTLEEYCQFLDHFSPSEVVALVDVGHAFLNRWSFPALVEKLGSRLHCLHLHDNNGIKDQHLPIGEGDLLWKEIWNSLSQAPAIQSLILEYTPGTPLKKLLTGKNIIENECSKPFLI